MIDCENKKCAVYFGVIIVFVCSCVLFGVYNNGKSSSDVRAGISKALGEQRKVTDRITETEIRAGDSEVRVDNSKRAVESAEGRAERVTEIITDTGDSIERCRAVLREVRKNPIKKSNE